MQLNNYSFELDGQEYLIPDPIIIGSDALKKCKKEKLTGLIAAYDEHTQAGGILLPNQETGTPQWVIYMPISESEFSNEINKIFQKMPIKKPTYN